MGIVSKGAGKLIKIMRKSGKKKKPTEAEGARLDPITKGSVKASREVDAGKSGKVKVSFSDPEKIKKAMKLTMNFKKYVFDENKKRMYQD